MEWVSVGAGRLAVTHRPRLAALPMLATDGVTHVVTLLSAREGAEPLGAAATAAGLRWVWIPVPNGQEPTADAREVLAGSVAQLAGLVRAGAVMVIHCSAGVHRTGMVAFAVLRTLGLNADEARAALARMRPVTAIGVGERRLGWAEQIAALSLTPSADTVPEAPEAPG